MSKRKNISKKIRFEIFKRDSFTCQYCGEKAPNVVLEVDHILPVSKGGDNNEINLITSCHSCNNGKRDILLSDRTTIEKQREKLESAQEKRNQLSMMAEWREELANIDNDMTDIFEESFYAKTSENLSESGRIKALKLIKKYCIEDVLNALDISIESYYDGTYESACNAFDKITGILIVKEKSKKDKYSHMKYYIRKSLKERFNYFNDRSYFSLMDRAVSNETSEDTVEFFKQECLRSRNFSELMEYLDGVVNFDKYQEEE